MNTINTADAKKVAIVTGGAQGIGFGICKKFAAAGMQVALVDVCGEQAEQAAGDLRDAGFACRAFLADLSRGEDVKTVVGEIAAAFGRIDIVVNNAAPGRDRTRTGRLSLEDWRRHDDLVVSGAMRLIKGARPYLAARGGCVVNVSSVTANAIEPDHCVWAYSVAKAALESMTRYLAVMLGEEGIRVNAVAPGLVDRDTGPKLTDNPDCKAVIEKILPLKRAARACEIADAVLFLTSSSAAYITGQLLTIDGGLTLLEPFGAALRCYAPVMDKAISPS